MTEKLVVTITKTADGKQEYIQILSADAIAVNVVLVAGGVELRDMRPRVRKKPA